MSEKHAHYITGTAIDWAKLRERLELAKASFEGSAAPSLEEKRKILKARAAILAQKPEGAAAPETRLEVLEFMLAYERYGIEAAYVDAVCPLRDLTALPGTPPFVLGVINLRGRILPVIDIRRFFDLPEKGLTDLNKVIVLRDSSMEFGILADLIAGMRFVPLEGLQTSLPTLTGVRSDYLRGITSDRLAVLDAGRILSDKRIIVNEQSDR